MSILEFVATKLPITLIIILDCDIRHKTHFHQLQNARLKVSGFAEEVN
jgi:hypothetical protein